MKTLIGIATVMALIWMIVSRFALVIFGLLATLWFVGAILDTFRTNPKAPKAEAA